MPLHDTPGIIVVSTEQHNGKLIVHGLRDPLAVDPQEIARRFKLDDDEVFFFSRTGLSGFKCTVC